MDKQFWLDKWQKKDTKFDQIQVNPYLIKHERIFESLESKRIFVPLCGKSIDIMWFLKQGAEVIGVELSTIAIESFFAENNVTYEKINKDHFTIYQAKSLKFICGDFFQLDKNDVGDIDWIYDRASLIALDNITRVEYAQKISQLTLNKSKMMLITLSYKTSVPEHPPYSVTDEEVHLLFSKNFQINTLAQNENLDIMPHLIQRGLTDLTDRLYLLTKLN